MPEWKETQIHVDGADLKVMEAGNGKPLLVLHDELGPTAWLKWHDELSAHRRLIMPVQPGFRGERTGWIRSVRDISVLYGHMLRAMKVSKTDVIGFSFGGWVAAEMAVNNPDQFITMSLVAPFGVQPETGFIMDFFPMTSADYIKSSVRDPQNVPEFATLYGTPGPEQFEAIEDARTECARLAWEPFMFDPSLPALLGGVDSVPTTIFWGADDAILPESAVRIYERSIKGAKVQVFKNCGHRPEIEAQADFTRALVRFWAEREAGMKIGYFVEQQYGPLPEEAVYKNGGFFGLPNEHFDPAVGAQLYHRYIKEYLEAERVGFDAMVLNEHHANPACMSNVMGVEASILAYASKKARIVMLGSPLPIMKNPMRAAEELAMIDMISGGRLVPGIIRGAAWEQVASNTNPAFNRELFDEAHDFLIQAWTRPGPWRYEGKHFHYRFVNPWARPLQKKPQIWIPGVISPETVVWAAEHAYPYIALATEIPATAHMWNLYGETAQKMGYQVGSENFGYFQKLIVADSDEEAYELGKGHVFGGSFTPTRFGSLPGYNSKNAVKNYATQFYARVSPRMAHQDDPAAQRAALEKHYERLHQTGHIITGTPKTVIPKLRHVLEALRPGFLTIWGPEGPVPHEKTMRMMELMGSEVLPALREFGREFNIEDAFEREPGSRPLPANGKWTPIVKETAAA